MRRALLLWLILSGAVAAEYDENRLNVSNPFYEPYAGDIFVQNAWFHQSKKGQVEVPPQTIFFNGTPVNYAGHNAEETESKQFTQLTIKVGIADWFSIGGSGRYMLQSRTETNTQGGFTPGNKSEKNSGFHDPYFSASFRFAGTERNDWYFSTELRYQPGLQIGGTSTPNDIYTTITGFGWNASDWTFGLATFLRYEENKKITAISPQLLVQYDLQPFYFRAMGGVLRAFSSTLESDWQPVMRGEVGLLMGENTSLSFLVDQKFPVSTTANVDGTTAYVKAKNDMTLSIALSSAF